LLATLSTVIISQQGQKTFNFIMHFYLTYKKNKDKHIPKGTNTITVYIPTVRFSYSNTE